MIHAVTVLECAECGAELPMDNRIDWSPARQQLCPAALPLPEGWSVREGLLYCVDCPAESDAESAPGKEAT